MKLAMVVYWIVAMGPATDVIPMDLCQQLSAKQETFELELDQDFETPDGGTLKSGERMKIEKVDCFEVEVVPCPEDRFCLW